MRTLQKILQILLILSLGGCELQKLSELKKFKDVRKAVLRDDGLYNVICMDGTIETGISLEQIDQDNVCNNAANDDLRTQFIRVCKLGKEAPEFQALRRAAGEKDCDRIYDVIASRSVLNIFAFPPANADALTTIEPLKYFPELKELGVFAQKITDLRPLSGLKKLRVLALTYNQIKDVSPLKDLENLEYLNLSNNQIKDFSPVEKLPRLKELIR